MNILTAIEFSARRREVERAECTFPYMSTRDERQQSRKFKCEEYVAFLFPGQGSQYVGMGRGFIDEEPIIKNTIETISEACHLPIFDYCQKTSDRDLQATERAQIAIFAFSVAIAAALRAQGIAPALFCGHSLGHFVALVSSGALSLEEASHLVALRGRLMASAGSRSPGGMVISLGVERASLEQAIRDSGHSIWCANENGLKQIVLSCARDDLSKAEALVASCGGRSRRLPVSGAFHCPLLKEEAEEFACFVGTLKFSTPSAPLIRNRDGALMSDGETLRADLRGHMLAPVLWTLVMDRLKAEGVSIGIECGPGRVLKGLMLRHLPSLPVFETETREAFLRAVKAVS